MDEKLWSDVDTYIEEKLLPADATLEAVLSANREAGLPAIDVSPAQAAFLKIMVKVTGAARILEIGTLGAYSSINMARALPDEGRLVTLECDPRHAKVARANVERASLGGRIEIITGAAADSLAQLAGRKEAVFDLVFIDADKTSNALYLDWAVKLSRPGATIILDNVVREGRVIDHTSTDASTQGTRAAFDYIAARPGLTATALQTVGSKGYDGFIILTVNG